MQAMILTTGKVSDIANTAVSEQANEPLEIHCGGRGELGFPGEGIEVMGKGACPPPSGIRPARGSLPHARAAVSKAV